MPELLTRKALLAAVRSGTFIEQGDVAGVDGIKVDLHMGDLFLKAQYVQPMRVGDLPAVERSALHIDPGEVVFVMTKERLHLPPNMMASLSPKRTLAHGGIVILGGLAVDPGYWGSLWLGLYNASSMDFPLSEGRRLISALFYTLSHDEMNEAPGLQMTAPNSSFPEELTAMIAKYRPVDSKGLQDQIQDMRTELRKLRDDITSDNQWKTDFKRSLDDLVDKTKEGQSQIVAIGALLQRETETREAGEREIKTSLSTVLTDFKGLRSWRAVALAVGGGLLTLLLASIYHSVIDKPAASTAPTYILAPGYSSAPSAAAPPRNGAH